MLRKAPGSRSPNLTSLGAGEAPEQKEQPHDAKTHDPESQEHEKAAQNDQTTQSTQPEQNEAAVEAETRPPNEYRTKLLIEPLPPEKEDENGNKNFFDGLFD